MNGLHVRCWCGTIRPAYVPRGGDGSGLRVRKHRGADGATCPGTWRVFTETETPE